MPDHLTWRVLYAGRLARVTDVRCRSGRCGRGGEECNHDNSIVFPRRGVFVKHEEGETVAADANTVLFFRRGHTYRVSHPADCGDDCTSINIAEGALREVVAELDPSAAESERTPLVFSHGPSAAAEFAAQCRLVRELASQREDLEVEETVLGLTASLLHGAYRVRSIDPPRQRVSPATRRAHRELAEGVKVFLATCNDGRVDLGGVARAVHSSPYHVSRVFRQQTGETISRYLQRLRARRALSLVIDGAGDLSRTAISCGFFDQSHMTNAFRHEFGVSPRAFLRGEMSNGVQV